MNGVLFALLALFWGGSFVGIKFVVEGFPPLWGAVARVGIAALVLLLFFFVQRKSLKIPRAYLPRVWMTGIFSLGIPFSLLFWGELHVSAGLAGIINGTVPIWTFVLGVTVFQLGESVTRAKKQGILLGFIGLLVIFFPKIQFGGTQMEILALFAILMMAISYGAGSVLNRQISLIQHQIPFEANLFHQHLASFVYLVVVALIFSGMPHILLPVEQMFQPVLGVAYLAVFSTAVALGIYYYLIGQWGALRGSAVNYVIPVVGIILDFFVLGNSPMWNEVLGIGFILSGVFLMQRSTRKAPGGILTQKAN